MTDAEALNAAYRERAQLVALLASLYPSHIGHNDPNEPEWAVVTVELPTGQACWHVAPDDMHLFSHVQRTTRICRGWDGHTTEEKYERIRGLIAEIEGGLQPRVPFVAAFPAAMTWTGGNTTEVINWILATSRYCARWHEATDADAEFIAVDTAGLTIHARVGDRIVRGTDGEFRLDCGSAAPAESGGAR